MPENVQYIRTVEIIAFLDLEQHCTFFIGLKSVPFGKAGGLGCEKL
jgi:hypothetical protein